MPKYRFFIGDDHKEEISLFNIPSLELRKECFLGASRKVRYASSGRAPLAETKYKWELAYRIEFAIVIIALTVPNNIPS